ncbi:MAG TPA: hypothetical protein DCP08_02235 [Chloroflexi bacterium]|nr:hypothetical protein [Chloroflexota bacterium]
MFLWPIFLLFFLALPIALVVGAYLLYWKTEQAGGLMPVRPKVAPTGYTRACPSCGRFLQEGWVKYPHCGSEIFQARE